MSPQKVWRSVMSFDVFLDYTCGFSNRARHWLDALDSTELVWRPFSLPAVWASGRVAGRGCRRPAPHRTEQHRPEGCQ